jgi:hypothetical protein
MPTAVRTIPRMSISSKVNPKCSGGNDLLIQIKASSSDMLSKCRSGLEADIQRTI